MLIQGEIPASECLPCSHCITMTDSGLIAKKKRRNQLEQFKPSLFYMLSRSSGYTQVFFPLFLQIYKFQSHRTPKRMCFFTDKVVVYLTVLCIMSLWSIQIYTLFNWVLIFKAALPNKQHTVYVLSFIKSVFGNTIFFHQLEWA